MMLDDEPYSSAKRNLFFISVVLGFIVGVIAKVGFDKPGYVAIGIGFIYTVAHPIIGGIAVLISEFLATIALELEKGYRWDRESCVNRAAIWPIVLIYWLVVFIPLAVINHLFRE